MESRLLAREKETGGIMLMGVSRGEHGSWFVLRTAGRSTLVLAKTLEEDGFEVWTPVKRETIRVPRMNVRREIVLPLLPSFVFVRAKHLVDLLELAQMIEKPRRGPGGQRPAHRDFRVFHYLDQIPMIADRDLDPMRQREAEAVPKKRAARFERGASVRVKSGAFEGLKGKVERSKSGYALVIFDDWKRPAKIPTFLLTEDEAIMASYAAKAA
jgi:transcription antitermination factor NusG